MLTRFLASVSLLVALSLLLVPTPSSAQSPIAFDFTATVDGSFDLTGGQVVVPDMGTAITGTYTFDADTPDLFPGLVTLGSYPDATSCVEVDWAGGHMLEAAVIDPIFEIGDITVQDDAEDLYFVTVDSDTAEVDDLPFDRAYVQIALRAPDGQAVVTDAMPLTPPDPLLFPTLRSLVITMQPDISVPAERAEISATIQTLSLGTVGSCPVPEPTAWDSLCAALPLLAALTKRRLRGAIGSE